MRDTDRWEQIPDVGNFSTQHPSLISVRYARRSPPSPDNGPAGVTKSSPGMADCHENPVSGRPFRQRNRATSIT